MSILLHRDYLGTSLHALISDNQIRWTNEIKNSHFVMGGDKSYNSLEPLLRLYDIDVPDFVPEKFRKCYEACGAVVVPWKAALPKRMFLNRFKQFVLDLAEIEKMFSTSQYPQMFIKSNELFDHLCQSRIDAPLIEKYLSINDSHSLKTILKLSKNSLLPTPVYDRVSTKTGRLTIKGGPQILTLNKDYRSIFRPLSAHNTLMEIDFISLEPRVALNFAEVDASNDVYISFLQHTNLQLNRDIAKLAILCSLYGAGRLKLDEVLRKEDSQITSLALIRHVNDYFHLSKLKSMLNEQMRSGMIMNYFGRPIEADQNSHVSKLVNNFLQSSAADVAILGFLDFVQKFKGICSPLFIIHDALVFDVKNENIEYIKEYVNSGFTLKGLGNFPLKMSRFRKHE